MKKLILETPRGTRDFPPEQKIIRDRVISNIKEIFEIYGYSPLETPIFEKLEILEAKFGAGENSDAISEIYRFKDQGNRDLGLRYEFTFSLARFVAQNPQLKLPFKRYQIGSVFRDGPIKAGRYREFYQCDIDTIGVSSVLADAESLAVVKDVFERLNLEVVIEINNRKLLTEIISFYNINNGQENTVIITLDKLKKIGIDAVREELITKGIDENKIDSLLDLLIKTENKSNIDKISFFKETLGDTQGLKEMQELLEYLDVFKVDVEFIPTLARGLGYYTGPVYEVFLKDQTIINSSIAGGGRWDKMIGKYVNNENLNYFATGVSFGIEPIMDVIFKQEKEIKQTVTELFIIPINTKKEAIKITQKLRKKGLKVQVDLLDRSVSKNIEYADKLKIPYVGFLGEDEIKENKIKIKNLKTGNEELLSIDDVKI